jgi:hypothetical protein
MSAAGATGQSHERGDQKQHPESIYHFSPLDVDENPAGV